MYLLLLCHMRNINVEVWDYLTLNRRNSLPYKVSTSCYFVSKFVELPNPNTQQSELKNIFLEIFSRIMKTNDFFFIFSEFITWRNYPNNAISFSPSHSVNLPTLPPGILYKFPMILNWFLPVKTFINWLSNSPAWIKDNSSMISYLI